MHHRIINPLVVQNISSQESLFIFLREHLNWKFPEDLPFEDLTYYWDTDEFGLNKNYFKGSSVFQIRPLNPGQPWGIFIIELKTPKLSITELRNIIRGLAPSVRKVKDYPTWKPQHLLFICTHDWKNYTFAHFTGDKPNTAKLLTFGWEFKSSYIRTVCEHNLSALVLPEDLNLFGEIASSIWIDKWREAFNIKKVTDKFFEEIKQVFREISQNYIHGIKNDEEKRAFTQLLINRLLFLKFLERKGWLFTNENDPIEVRQDYLNILKSKYGSQNLWENFFYFLFHHGLNRFDSGGKRKTSDEVTKKIGTVPFLNGGLFSLTPLDKIAKADNKAFDLIFDRLLNPYNFTIEENTPLDIQVALNPDLLGYAYEELIADRHGQGAFYTHPTEVGLMCREALKTYLEEYLKINPRLIAKLVDLRDADELTEAEAFDVYDLLLKIKILDPAVGSGAYPVRMMQEIIGIHQAIAKKISAGNLRLIVQNRLVDPRSIYQLKLSIMQNNLYGADIDYFAVEIAKLRFWLSLVVDYEIEVNSISDLKKIPALPNLDFKLRVGDSLLSLLGKVKTSKGQLVLNLDSFIRNLQLDAFSMQSIHQLRDVKNKYFQYEELRKSGHIELSVSKMDLIDEINKLEENIASSLGIGKHEKFENINHILWQIHFAEIFSESGEFGFDICIANPPYLRQEKINWLFNDFNSAINKEDLVKAYEKIYEHLELKIDRKCDLYVYFFLRGLQLLKEKGVLCYICSNSWLDVGYGKILQEVLLRQSRVKAIYDNSAKRSFEKADVNTTINLFVKDTSVDKIMLDGVTRKKTNISAENTSRFVTFRDDFEKVAVSEEMQTINEVEVITSTDKWRVYPINQNELYKNGLDEENDYEGDKWGGKYLRAPDIFFTILEKGKDKLVRLGDIAEVRRGFTTGANEFFYLDDEKIAKWGIERKFLRPVIKSPRECKTIKIKNEPLSTKIIICHKSKNQLKGTNLLKYINWGEKQITDEGVNWNEVPSVKGRELWYAINENYSDNFIIPRTFNDAYICHVGGINYSDRFYGIVSSERKLITYFNSMIFVLFTESLAKQGLGLGALDLNIRELVKIPLIINFKKNVLIKREVRSVFEEIGVNDSKLIRSQELNLLPDRKALDDIIFDALGLTKAEREEVYYAVCELVQNRLNKARSV